jgi:hypothetical protein
LPMESLSNTVKRYFGLNLLKIESGQSSNYKAY